MEVKITNLNLDAYSKKQIERLLSLPQDGRSNLEQMWYLMDKVWDECGCDNKNLNWQRIGQFYSHPVWLLNGLFIEQDEISMQHREAISDWIAGKSFQTIVDYGGGHGTLAKLISERNSKCNIEIYEPHPSDYAKDKIKCYDNVNIVDRLNQYDCLVSTDVLEHIPDPLLTFYKMKNSVVLNGYLVIANNFHPVIKCHLPCTFHLRYSFNSFAKMLGLEVVGKLHGSHATIYKKVKTKNFDMKHIRKFEILSKSCYPLLDRIHPVARKFKRFVRP